MKRNTPNTLAILLIAALLSTTSLLLAQCYPDRHNTSWNTQWASCESTQNPNTERGEGHWILYDLQYNYELGASHLWNINDPENLNSGANEVIVDLSSDGETWEEWGSFFLAQAPGSSIYEGVSGPDLTGNNAQFVLLTIESNHGGSCYGFAEVRMDVNGIVESVDEIAEIGCLKVSVYPNPFTELVNAEITSECNEPVQYAIYDATGRMIYSERLNNGAGTQTIRYGEDGLAAGIYYLEVTQGAARTRSTLVKMDR